MAIFTQNPDYTAKIVNVNQTVVGESYKMSQVIADFNAIGIDCDSVIMHDWRGIGYGAFIPLKITEQGTYYVGDNDLKSGLGTNATLWQKSNTVWGGHYYRYVNGVPTDYGALSLGSQTVDDIEYWYDYDGNVSYIPLFYLNSSITVVINKVPVPPSTKYTANGGGATHIAKVTGQLKDLSSNLSDILMVSGGGGGGLLVGDTIYNGADAGGISGSGSNSGNQSTGYAFGQGESGTNKSGGGSGLYGGYKSNV